MAITFTQAQVNAAVNYLMTGGPNDGELTTDQYNDMVVVRTYGPITNFGICIQLAAQQNHPGLANSKNVCRDFWGTPNDALFAFFCGPLAAPGRAARLVQALGASIAG